MYEEALAEFKKEDSEIWAGIAYAFMGKKGEAQRILEKFVERSKQVFVSPYLLALLCFSLKDDDLGFEWLQKAYESHYSWLIFLGVEPLFNRVGLIPDL